MKDLFADRPSKYPSRNPNNLYVPKANKISYDYRSYRIQGPKLWNSLSKEMKAMSSLQKFKEHLAKLEMPFCSCMKCLTTQIRLGSDSSVISSMIKDLNK